MAGQSVAEGIALQYKAPDYTKDILRQAEEGNRARAAKIKGQQDVLKKYEKDIQIDKNLYHPILLNDQAKDTAETWHKVIQNYQQDPEHFVNKAQEMLIDFQGRSSMRVQKSKNYWDAEKADSGNLTPEGADLQKRMKGFYGKGEEAFVNGTQDISKNSLGYAGVSPEGGVFLRERPKDTNVAQRVMNMYKDLAATVDPTVKSGGVIGNQQLFEIVRQAPDDVKKQALQSYFQNNPSDLEAYRYVNKDKIQSGALPDDPNAIFGAAVDEYSKMPAKIATEQLRSIPRPRAESAGEKKIKQDVPMETNVKFGTGVPTVKKSGEPYIEKVKNEATGKMEDVEADAQKIQSVAKAGWSFNAVPVQTTPGKVINMTTGKEEEVSGARDYDFNQVLELPTVKAAGGKKIIVSEKTMKEIEDRGKKEGKPNPVKYEKYAIGLEKAGMQGGEQVLKPRAVPLTPSLEEQLKKRGVTLLGGQAEAPKSGTKIRVKVKATGKIGSIPEEKFDATIFEKL